MKIFYDKDKNAANQLKHGIPLSLAAEMEWEAAIVWPDARREYGENRMAGIGYIGLRLFFIVFVDRAEGRRIISLRKANPREIKRYAQA